MSGRPSHPVVHDGSLRRPPASFSFRIVPDPLPSEPAHGWALRAARMNGHPSLPHLAFQIGMSGCGSPSAWLEIARRSDVPGIKHLAANTPAPRDDGYMVRDEWFGPRRLTFEHRRFCPACLGESAHHRFFWDFTFFGTCPFHDRRIRGGRHDTDMAVDWRGTDLRVSRDGRILQAEARAVAVLPRTMETYVLGRLGVVAPFSAPVLDPFPIDDILSALRPLGILLTLPEELLTTKRDKSWVLLARHQRAGFDALAGDLSNLEDRLSDVADRSRRSLDQREQVSRWKLFGSLPRPESGLWSVVDDAVKRVTRRTASARRGDCGTPGGKLRYTLPEFADELGILARVLSGFIDSIGLVPHRRSISGVVQYLRSDVEAVAGMIDTSMRAGEVSALLGINNRRISDLVASGLIRMVPGGGQRPLGKWYMRSDVEALAGLVDSLPEPSVATVTFDALAKNMDIRFSELVRRVVSGEVVPVGQAGTAVGFRRLRFDLSSMAHPAARGVSAVSAAALLGLTQKTVKWLVAEGHLKSVNGDMRRYGIVQASVDRLLAEYEPTDAYAPKLGCSPRIAAYKLAEMGVRVIKRGPSDAGSGMASGRGLAHRGDLARLLCDNLETVAVSPELVDGWERLRAAALTSEGCWVLPAILSAAEMRLFMSSMKLAVTLRFGDSATLTADCSPSSAVRRSRILDAARPFLAERLPLFREAGPGGWLLSSEIRLGTGATTVTEAHATWLRDALSSLGRMFASRDAV